MILGCLYSVLGSLYVTLSVAQDNRGFALVAILFYVAALCFFASELGAARSTTKGQDA